MINHPLVVGAALFFAVALMGRYAEASQAMALLAAFPFGVFGYAQARMQQLVTFRDYRKRNLELFVYVFVFVYAFMGLPYLINELVGEIPQKSVRVFALFGIGFGLACVSLGRLNMIKKEETHEA
ncbi:MAG: hypothetical protein HOE48_01065 [Candidatus Latescibacteria bacterium]|nr:hypothetical protein [Candidatus Latescibacterota bacterium]MBT4136466.1 hypothetical protein [Candidatus Latescibacterota bacterium]MBT5831029.1 hypothetical protein [Candidatus Latescibacterota bacterium]